MVLDRVKLLELLREVLDKAGNTHRPTDVLQAVTDDKAQLWVGAESFIITEIIEAPIKKVCRIWLAGGDLKELLKMEKDVYRWAGTIGCDAVEIVGRPGWVKSLKGRGYKSVATVLVRDTVVGLTESSGRGMVSGEDRVEGGMS